MPGANYARIKDPNLAEHYVYRLNDVDGHPLYVGCTMNMRVRMQEQRRHGLFGHLIDSVDAYGPYTFAEGRDIERQLIQAIDPKFNIEWTRRDPRHAIANGSRRRSA